MFGASAPDYDSVVPFFAYWGVVLARRAGVRFDEDVLDVGCGIGASLIPASSVSGWATGVDASLAMLEHLPWPVPLVAADATALPLRDESYDVAIAGFLLQFVADPAAACVELRRVLRRSGRAVVSLPEPSMPGVAQVQAAWAEQLGVRLGSPRAGSWVEDALRAAGFAFVEAGADEHTFWFESGADYVRWQWSHGGRALLGEIPTGQLEAFERELAEAAEANRAGDRIPMPTTARFWIAHRSR